MKLSVKGVISLPGLMILVYAKSVLERDLIRQRDWDYFALAFGVRAEKHEALRNEIIERYGGKVKLISLKEEPDRNRNKKRRGKRK